MKNKPSGVVIPTLDPAIDTSMVQNTRSIDIPPAAPFTDVKGMLGEIESATAQFTQAQEQKAKAAQETEQVSLTDLLRQQLGTPGQAELQNQAYSTAGGVNDIDMQLAEVNASIMKEQNALTRRLQALEKNPSGLFGGALEQEIDKVERESLAKQADMYVIQQGIQGRYNAAKDAADRAIQARMAYDQRLIDIRQSIYERNKGFFDKTEQRAFEAKQQELQVTLEEKQTLLKQVSDLSLNALQNGAPPAIASQMRAAKTPEEAMTIGGQYIGLQDRLNAQATRANIYDEIQDRKERLRIAEAAALKEIDEKNATKQEINESKSEKALGMLQSVNNLLTHTGLQGAVGPNPLARIETSSNPIAGLFPGGPLIAGMFSGNKSEFIAEVDRLANTLTLENMNLLKGPATDKDVEIVNASMSRLKNRDVTESSYVKELQRIQSAMQRIVNKVGITPEQAQYWYGVSPDAVNEADALWDNAQTTIQIAPSLSY